MQLFDVVDTSRSIFIPGEVISSKRNYEIGFCYTKDKTSWFFKQGETYRGIRPVLTHSKRLKEYISNTLPYLLKDKPAFKRLLIGKEKPYRLQILFIRRTHASFDFHNMVQGVMDCITGQYWKDDKQVPRAATQWIDDDDISNVLVYPPNSPPYYLVDKENPGVWITVL